MSKHAPRLAAGTQITLMEMHAENAHMLGSAPPANRHMLLSCHLQKTLSTFRGFKEHPFECPVNPTSSSVLLPILSMIGIGSERLWAGFETVQQLAVCSEGRLLERFKHRHAIDQSALIGQIENVQRADRQQATRLCRRAAAALVHEHDQNMSLDRETDRFVFAVTELDGLIKALHFLHRQPLRETQEPVRDSGRGLWMTQLGQHSLGNHDFAKKIPQQLHLTDQYQIVQRRGIRHHHALHAHAWSTARIFSPLTSSSSHVGCCSAP